MAKRVQVVLNEEVINLGKDGDLVEVAPGYARNYLLPNNLATEATERSLLEAERIREVRLGKEKENENMALSLKEALEDSHIVISQSSTDEGTLYASITKEQIINAIEKFSSIRVEEDLIVLPEPIKEIGLHKLILEISSEIKLEIELEIVPEAGN